MQYLASAFIAIYCCLHLGQTVPWSLDVGWQKWENSSILRHPFRDNRSRARRQPIKIRCPHFKLFWFNSLAIFNWFAWEANSLPQYHNMPLRTIRLVVPRSQGNKGLWKKFRLSEYLLWTRQRRGASRKSRHDYHIFKNDNTDRWTFFARYLFLESKKVYNLDKSWTINHPIFFHAFTVNKTARL